jgi:two-component system, cell cycle sensor histidine kinase and response regulator CckA
VWERLTPAWITDPPSDSNFPRAEVARSPAAFGFPVRRGERVFAILEFFTRDLREMSPEFLGACDTLGAHLAIVFERRRVEEQRARLAAFVEASPDIIASASPDGRMTYMNVAGRRLLGIGEQEEIGRYAISDLYTDERFARLRDEVLPQAVKDGVWRGDLPLRARDGHAVPVSHVLVAHRPRGEVEFFACVGHDLSDRHRLEDEVRQAQKLEAVGRLAAGLAHDFNNYLTSIMCAGAVALDRLPEGHEARREVEEILASSERAAGLTRQLLAFSRRQALVPRVFDVNALLASTERMLRRLLGADIDLRLVPAAGLGPVRADPGQLEQVVVNLALNARDAMPRGGRLTLETRAALRHHAPHVELAVSDTGSGMDAATRARVFEPFFTTKEPGRGTGLGLSTAFGIVTQSGGEIEVESAPGEGSTFRVWLPVCDAPVERGDTPPLPGRGAGHGTILIVDDEEGVRRSLRLLLQHEGYAVLEASDGSAALEIAERQPQIDLVISDVLMPGLSADDLIERLERRRPGIRALVMSGDESLGAARAPGRRFIAKPFTVETLTRAVRAALA